MRTTIADGGGHLARVLEGSQRTKFISLMLGALSAGPLKRKVLTAVLRATGRKKLSGMLPWYADHSADGYFRTVERILDYRAEFSRKLDTAGGGALDVVLSPATTLPALLHGGADESPFGTYTLFASLLGWPAGVVPVTTVRNAEESATWRGNDRMDRAAAASEAGSAGLPIGVQVMARAYRDDVALSVMQTLERLVNDVPQTPIDPRPLTD
jgi:fatty acid amide hydrolase